MQNYWIIGHPLKFCLCTPVMNGVFQALDMQREFSTHDIEPDKLEDVFEKITNHELEGAVVTMPFKTPSLERCDELTEEARAINAVNFVKNREGKLKGYNTDWQGAVNGIKTKIAELKGKHILVLGAGGAARAAAYGFNREGARVSMWNRTPERAQAFAEQLGVEFIPDMREWDERPDIIVNATSASYQERQSTLVPFPLWQNVILAMDAVYGKTSLFLEEAMAAQVPNVLSGETWFKHQAIPMFKIITGEEAPLELVNQLTTEHIPDRA